MVSLNRHLMLSLFRTRLMTRGRKPSTEQKTQVLFYIEKDLLTRISLRVFDPAVGRAGYGEFSSFINNAIRAYLIQQETDSNG